MTDELYRYGFTRQQWQAAREEICQILIEQAKVRGMTAIPVMP